MVKRLRFFGWYGLFWLIYFLLSKVFFLLLTEKGIHGVGWKDLIGVFFHGFIMDLSATAYLMVIPGLLLVISVFGFSAGILRFLKIYSVLFLVIIGLLVVVDAELYGYWGYRLDATPLLYLKTPGDAFASATIGMYIKDLFLMILVIGSSIYFFKRIFRNFKSFDRISLACAPVFLLLTGLLIVPIRGGFGIAPMNTGKVYFSQNNYLNHAAINLFWNVGFSLTELNPKENQYQFFTKEKQEVLVKPMIGYNTPSNQVVLKAKNPNIIIFVLESFSAKVIGALGGISNITPNINKLSEEGILFTNFFASGDRSDKGLVAVISGYPAQPSTSIIKFPSKTQSLPRLSLSLRTKGYNSSFYYGGDVDFANMRSYLFGCAFDKIVSKDDFPASTYNSKWGAHDHIVLDKFFNDICLQNQPFFNVLFTLSSHEPFEVPGNAIPGKDPSSRLMNAIHYTDSCLGVFFDKAKKQSWWNNTLIILVADHGHPDPGHSLNHVPEKFRIPMLWVGGAVSKAEKVEKYASQTDIASTILHQLEIPSDKYVFSKNIFSTDPEFAFYAFNNGFGYFKPQGGVVFDCDFSRELINNLKDSTRAGVDTGKAYLQNIYKDLNERK